MGLSHLCCYADFTELMGSGKLAFLTSDDPGPFLAVLPCLALLTCTCTGEYGNSSAPSDQAQHHNRRVITIPILRLCLNHPAARKTLWLLYLAPGDIATGFGWFLRDFTVFFFPFFLSSKLYFLPEKGIVWAARGYSV